MEKELALNNQNKTTMNIKFANTWSEKSFFITPVIAYNGKDKELLISFICFALLITLKRTNQPNENNYSI
jgi:hypothetical protein